MSQQLIEKILSNTASGEDKEQFNLWLQSSKNNQLYFDQVKAIWTRMDGVYTKTEFDLALAKQKIEMKIVRKQAKLLQPIWIHRIAVAASIVLFIAASFFIYHQSTQIKYEEFTSSEVIRDIELKDGSHVWLNKHSTIKLPENFTQKDRTVTLNGEAYFEVKRDEKRPFKVITGKTFIKVLGTSFNIHQDTLSGNVDLDVKTGRVAFCTSKNEKVQIIAIANEQALFNNAENTIEKLQEKDLNYLSWKTGILKFNETPLQQVCSDLSKYYGLTIQTNIKDKELLLTANFRNEQLSNILASIELTLDLKITHQSGKYIIEAQND